MARLKFAKKRSLSGTPMGNLRHLVYLAELHCLRQATRKDGIDEPFLRKVAGEMADEFCAEQDVVWGERRREKVERA